MTTGESWDYIIVGAGSAGSVLANRLSEDGTKRVLVLEAGGRDWHPFIHIPAGFYKLLSDERYNWRFWSEPEEATGNRRIAIPRGKVLGGSSSINGSLFVRGQPLDYDTWAQMGNRGWSYEEVLPFFKRLETFHGESSDAEARGSDGPIHVRETKVHHPLMDAFIDAAGSIGYPRNRDYNSGDQEGFGYLQLTQKGARRSSAATAYLHPAAKRQNLEVRTRAQVDRLIIEEGRAKGIVYRIGGQERRADARIEVILSAGAVQTPQLLELSGIGNGALLQGLGIPVVAHLPGVGENYRDHYGTRQSWRIRNAVTLNELTRGWRFAAELARYAFGGTGILTYGAGLVYGFIKSREGLASPDIQYHLAHASYADASTRQLHREPGMTLATYQMRPESAGSIHIASADPTKPPLIRPNFLADAEDRRVLVEGIKIARTIVEQAPLDRYRDIELAPGPQVRSDDEILAFARETGQTLYHMVGTAKMGSDPMAVVDDRLRVHGIKGLRVVDASVMPTLVSGNTNAATLMIAERAAAFIRDDARTSQAP